MPTLTPQNSYVVFRVLQMVKSGVPGREARSRAYYELSTGASVLGLTRKQVYAQCEYLDKMKVGGMFHDE